MSLFNELKRRNVFRVGIAYIIASWLLMQVADLVFPRIGLEDSAVTLVIALLGIGFIPALIFAWAFEMTPEGIKKEKDVDRTQSITQHTGRKLDFIIIGVLVAALAYFAYDKFVPSPGSETELVVTDGQAGTETVTAVDRSIAVLPFVNMSSDPEQEYFSDGISEEILNALAKIQELKVAGRTSSFSFKGKNEDLRLIGEALNVAHILEGSVRKSGNKLRITAQLIKVDDGFHMWSETYDRELTDIFAIQDEISSAILEQMKLQLIGEAAPTELASTRADVEAYNLYLAAKQNIYKRDKPSLELASSLLERAIGIDPAYAPAYAQRGIATLLLSENNYGDIPEDEAYEIVKPLFDKSIELDPGLAEGYAGLGLYYQDNDNQFEKSIEMLEKALAINPGLINARNWLQTALARTGELAKSGEIAEQILERDPLYRPAINNVGFYYVRTGQFEKQKALIDRVNLYMPGDSMIQRVEMMYQRDTGNYARATQLAEALWEQELARGENSRAAAFGYAVMLRATAQWERMLDLGDDGFQVLALAMLGRKEEAKILANKWALEDENFGAFMGTLMVEREFQQLIDFVEARWPNLDDFENEVPQRIGFGSGDLLDIAYAYQQVDNEVKFAELMTRVREAHDQQRANGANNVGIWLNLSYQYLLEDEEEKALTAFERARDFGFHAFRRNTARFPAFAALDGNPRYEELLVEMLAHVNGERAKLDLEPLEPEPYL